MVIALKLSKLYGPRNTTTSCRLAHEYLGIEMGFGTNPGTMILSMTIYLQKIIEDFPEVFRRTKAPPARDNLVKIRDEGPRNLLPKK